MEVTDFDAERLISPQPMWEDADAEISLRPKSLQEYIGQEKVKQNLEIYLEAARMVVLDILKNL